MKITRRHLRRIIREELLSEQFAQGLGHEPGAEQYASDPDPETEAGWIDKCCHTWTQIDPPPGKTAPYYVDGCGNPRGEPYVVGGERKYSCTWSRGPDVYLVDRIVDFAAEEVFPDFMEIAIATPKWLLDTTVDMVVETSKDLLIVGTVMTTKGAVLKTGVITPEQYVQSLLNLAVFVLLWYGGPVAFRAAGNVLFSAPSTATNRMAGEAVENLVWARANTYSDDVVRGSSDAVKYTAKTMDDAITASRSPAAASPSQRTTASPDKPAASVESQAVDEIIQSQKAAARQEAKSELARRSQEARAELGTDVPQPVGEPVPLILRRPSSTQRSGWEDTVRVAMGASKNLPDIAYTTFAKKLLVRIAQGLERSSADDIMVIYPDNIPTRPPWLSSEPPPLNQVSIRQFTLSDVISSWERIPGNPAGKGFKDFEPELIAFNIRNVLAREEAEQLAAQMFDQFPVMSSVYGKPSRFIDEFYNNFAIRVGRTSINRLGAQYPNHIEITPFRSGNALLDKWVGGRPGSRPPPLLGGTRQFIANTLDDNSRVYTHELDHWFRTKVIEKTGADPSRQYRDVYDAEGMVIRENWLKKWWEFEAEFTTVQFRLLDQIGSKGATPDVVRILENPVEFEKYFLANLKGITVDWEEPIYNQLMQRIRGRLFDTERGLYWALRRALEIPDPPRKPLPENIQINLRRWSTLAGII